MRKQTSEVSFLLLLLTPCAVDVVDAQTITHCPVFFRSQNSLLPIIKMKVEMRQSKWVYLSGNKTCTVRCHYNQQRWKYALVWLKHAQIGGKFVRNRDWRKSKKKKATFLLKKVLGECWNSKNKTHKHWLKRFAEVFESAFFIIWHLIISAISFLKKAWVLGLVMILQSFLDSH